MENVLILDEKDCKRLFDAGELIPYLVLLDAQHRNHILKDYDFFDIISSSKNLAIEFFPLLRMMDPRKNTNYFAGFDTLTQALNLIPLNEWGRIFNEPGITQHFQFTFPNVHEMMTSLNNLHHDGAKQAFLDKPDMLEAVLSGLKHEDRWIAIAENPDINASFIKHIKNSRADEILNLLGGRAGTKDVQEAVLSAARQGYKTVKENEKFHFFSPIKPHPFLLKLDATPSSTISHNRQI